MTLAPIFSAMSLVLSEETLSTTTISEQKDNESRQSAIKFSAFFVITIPEILIIRSTSSV